MLKFDKSLKRLSVENNLKSLGFKQGECVISGCGGNIQPSRFKTESVRN